MQRNTMDIPVIKASGIYLQQSFSEQSNSYIRKKFSVSEDEAQKLIYRYAGKGDARIENDIVKNVEFVTVDHAIGYYNEKGVWHETDRMQIIYSKSGTHVVPTNPKR